jgi:hypothetical protein
MKKYLAANYQELLVTNMAHSERMATYVNEQRCADNETRQRKSVADLLHQDTCRTEGRRCDVGAAEVVDNNTNSNVDGGHDALAVDKRLGVVAGFAHLRHNVEEGRCTSVCEDDGRNCCESIGGLGAAEKVVIRLPGAGLGSQRGAVLNSNGDGQGDNGGQNADDADPCEPGDAPESLNAAQAEADNGGDGDKDGGAGAVC